MPEMFSRKIQHALKRPTVAVCDFQLGGTLTTSGSLDSSLVGDSSEATWISPALFGTNGFELAYGIPGCGLLMASINLWVGWGLQVSVGNGA